MINYIMEQYKQGEFDFEDMKNILWSFDLMDEVNIIDKNGEIRFELNSYNGRNLKKGEKFLDESEYWKN